MEKAITNLSYLWLHKLSQTEAGLVFIQGVNMAFNPLEKVNYPNLPKLTDSTSSLPPIKKQRITKWLVGFLSLFLLVGVSYLVHHQLVKQQQQANLRLAVVPLKRTNFSMTVSANGTVKPERSINLSPKTAGTLKRLLVKEGDYVKEKQVLAYMDDSNLQGQLTQEQGRLAQAKANLRKLMAGNRPQDIAQAQAKLEELKAKLRKLMTGNRFQDIAQAQARLERYQATLSQAKDDFQRNQKLHDAGAISRQALNQKRADFDSAQAQVAEAQQALSLQTAGTRQEDIDQARAEVISASGALQNIQTQIDDTLIRAPFDGVVIRKYADPGAFVTPMTAGSSVSSATSSSILALADTNQVVANISESNISEIRVNQQVVIKADAYPGKTFAGRVSQIAAQATVEQNVTSFEVKVALFSDSNKLLRSGMNVSLEFNVGELQNALTVPTIAVTRQQKVTGVFVARKNQPPVFTPITTGATVNNRTQVKTGLNGTENILISLPPQPQNQSGISFPGLPGSSQAGSSQQEPPTGPPAGGAPPAH